MSSKRVTQKDIAKAAGVTQTAVSYALHGGGKLSDETRKKILEIAKKLGYRDDPMLRSLAAYRYQKNQDKQESSNFVGTIAWLIDVAQQSDWLKSDLYQMYYQGASDTAKKLGYKLEPFSLDDPTLSIERAHQILLHRGTQAALFAVPPDVRLIKESRIYSIDWEDLPVVALGSWPYDAKFHVVCSNQFDSMCLCVDKLIEMGYSRIGCMIEKGITRRVNGHFLGAFQSRQHVFDPEQVSFVPPLVLEWNGWDKSIQKWFKKYKPDAIVGLLHMTGTRLTECLKEIGVDVPQDVGVASLDAWREEKGVIAGIDENLSTIGHRAIYLADSLVRHDEKGSPERPIRQMVQPIWLNGASVTNQRS